MFQLERRRKHEFMHLFVLFSSIMLKHLELQSSSIQLSTIIFDVAEV